MKTKLVDTHPDLLPLYQEAGECLEGPRPGRRGRSHRQAQELYQRGPGPARQDDPGG